MQWQWQWRNDISKPPVLGECLDLIIKYDLINSVNLFYHNISSERRLLRVLPLFLVHSPTALVLSSTTTLWLFLHHPLVVTLSLVGNVPEPFHGLAAGVGQLCVKGGLLLLLHLPSTGFLWGFHNRSDLLQFPCSFCFPHDIVAFLVHSLSFFLFCFCFVKVGSFSFFFSACFSSFLC